MCFMSKPLLQIIFIGIIILQIIATNLKERDPTKVINVQDDPNDEFNEEEERILRKSKFLVNIHLRQEHVCSGAYIEPFWIVTTASCLTEPDKHYSVIMGSVAINGKDGQKRPIHQSYPHAQHKAFPLKFDIALIRLTKPFTTGHYIQMIKLAAEVLQDSTECSAFGWSVKTDNERVKLKLAETLTARIVPGSECDKVYGDYNVSIESSVVCSKSEVDLCKVDSGSPLTCQSRLMGILSATSNCGENNPSLFSSIPFFYHWINNYISSTEIVLRHTQTSSSTLIKANIVIAVVFVTIVFSVP